MIALIALMFFSMYRLNPNAPKTRELTQLEFFKALDDGKVVEPVVRFLDRDEGETFLTGEIETTNWTTRAIPSGRPIASRSSPARTRG